MPVAVILPKFGFTLETAEIVQWLKREGDVVRAGDALCEVTTDKVNMEVEAPEDGTVFGVLYQQGAVVPVTEVICYLLRPGEAPPETLPAKPAAALPVRDSPSKPAERAGLTVTPVAQRVAQAAKLDLNQIHGTGPNQRITRRDVEAALAGQNDRVRATPAARKLARQHNLDLQTIAGSGPRGRVQAVDVQAAAQTKPLSDDSAAALYRVVKLEGMRRTIADRLQKSFQTAPHIFFDTQVDTAGLDSLREKIKARGEKLSVTALLVKACAWALMRHAWLNATTDGETVTLWQTANIGVAVALENGLVVPVVHHAERLALREVQASVETLAARARGGGLRLNDMTDATFTISNLGMYGVDRFTAIINPPQVGILAVGRTIRQFVPDAHDRPTLRSFINLTLSADHRVVDGAQAAQFLAELRGVLEEPALLVW